MKNLIKPDTKKLISQKSTKALSLVASKRTSNSLLVLVILISLFIPIINPKLNQRQYMLSDSVKSLLGDTSPALSDKLAEGTNGSSFNFNDELRQSKDENVQKLGGSNYSVRLNKKAEAGINYFDPASNKEITLKPRFSMRDAKKVDGRIVYPLVGKIGQSVHTIHASGVKDDIILPASQGDEVTFQYEIDMDNTMEARLMPSGALGIVTADSAALNSDISYGSDKDKELIEKARNNIKKDKLVFSIPAPVIKQSGADELPQYAKAEFKVEDSILTIKAMGLESLNYPISIDPTVVVTSSSDFSSGETEGGVTVDTVNNKLSRSQLTGANISSWATTAAVLVPSFATAYNGYFYSMGDFGANGYRYGAISNGNVPTFNLVSGGLPAAVTTNGSAVAYHGYMYILGNTSRNVYYAPINSNGSLGSWTTLSNVLNVSRTKPAFAVSRGYLYVAGGAGDNSTEYAAIKPDGSLSSWTVGTTSPATLSASSGSVYNGRFYAVGTAGAPTDFYYASINSDGSLTSWTSTSSGNGQIATSAAQLSVYNGFAMTISGGKVYYSQINADGSLNSWFPISSATTVLAPLVAYNGYVYTQTSNFLSYNYAQMPPAYSDGAIEPTNQLTTNTFINTSRGPSADDSKRAYSSAVAYNGYLYILGGCVSSCGGSGFTPTYTNESAKINSDGSLGTWQDLGAGSDFPAIGGTYGSARMAVATYNNCIYAFGGQAGNPGRNFVRSVTINPNGTLGTWGVATTVLPATRSGAKAVAYNGYAYVTGGNGSVATVYSAPLNGTCGAANAVDASAAGWTTNNALNIGRYDHGIAVDGSGNVFVSGGTTASGITDTVEYAQINPSTHVVGTWTQSGNVMGDVRIGHGLGISNGFLYVWDGCKVAFTSCSIQGTHMVTTVERAPITNGVPGVWATFTNVVFGKSSPGTAVYNGYYYSGTGSQADATTYFGALNNGGRGSTQDWATSGNTLTTARSHHSTVAYNGYLYVMGGCTAGCVPNAASTVRSDVQLAAINMDGTLGSWSSTTSLPTSLYGTCSVAHNGHIYVIGGASSGASSESATVYRGNIGASGVVSSWDSDTGPTPLQGLPANRVWPVCGVYNSKIYVASGWQSNATQSVGTVYYHAIDSSGWLSGAWSSATSLNTARMQAGGTIYNGYVYVFGGSSNTSTLLDTYEYGQISESTGNISAWTAATQKLQHTLDREAVFGANGYMYILGGRSATGTTNIPDCIRMYINNNGSLSPPDSLTSLGATAATGRMSMGYAYYNGFIYLTGGTEGGGDMNDVKYAGVLSTPRIGVYSKLIDSNLDTTPTKLVSNGTNAGNADVAGTRGRGGLYIEQRSSMSSTNLFGALSLINSVIYGTLSNDGNYVTPIDASSTATGLARYYLVTVTLDDSQTATFSDAAGNISTITDLNLYYHPASTKHLRGGKTFTNESQQSLDASPL